MGEVLVDFRICGVLHSPSASVELLVMLSYIKPYLTQRQLLTVSISQTVLICVSSTAVFASLDY